MHRQTERTDHAVMMKTDKASSWKAFLGSATIGLVSATARACVGTFDHVPASWSSVLSAGRWTCSEQASALSLQQEANAEDVFISTELRSLSRR